MSGRVNVEVHGLDWIAGNIAIPADGGAQTCKQLSTYGATFTNTVNTYRISVVDDGSLSGVTSDDFHWTVAQAAEKWNEQASSGYFRYLGPTKAAEKFGDLDCDRDYTGLVMAVAGPPHPAAVAPNGGNPAATLRWGCWDEDIKRHTKWQMFIWRNYFTYPNVSIPWSVGLVGANEYDLMSATVHEFGHVLDLDHPSGGAATLAAAVAGSTSARDLFQYDTQCATQLGGRRLVAGYQRLHPSGADNFGAETTLNALRLFAHFPA